MKKINIFLTVALGFIFGASGLNAGSTMMYEDWIIGEYTSGNSASVAAKDIMSVSGYDVYIGKNAGANDNVISVAGYLLSMNIYVGSIDGNSGNMLEVKPAQMHYMQGFGHILIAPDNSVAFEVAWNDELEFLDYLFTGVKYKVYDYGLQEWVALDADNVYTYVDISTTDTGGLLVTAKYVIPEPAELAALLGAAVLIFALWRRRNRG